MTPSPGILQAHIDCSRWASERLIDAAASLAPEELTRDFGTADRTVLGTLAHIYAADRAWKGRLAGTPPAVFLDPERDSHLHVLQNDWFRDHV